MRGKFLDPLSARDDKIDHVRSAGGPTGLIAVPIALFLGHLRALVLVD